MVSRNSPHWIFRMINVKAKRLYLVGEFNDWSTHATPMEEVEPNTWEVAMALQPATYRFRYVTDDGRWFTDYAAFGIERNDYEGWDSIVHVPDVNEPVRTVYEACGLSAEGVSRLNDLMGLVLNVARKGSLLCENEDGIPQPLSRPREVRHPAAADHARAAVRSNHLETTNSAQAPSQEDMIFESRRTRKSRMRLSPVGV